MASEPKAQAWLAHSKAFGSPGSTLYRQTSGSITSEPKAQAWLAHSKAFGSIIGCAWAISYSIFRRFDHIMDTPSPKLRKSRGLDRISLGPVLMIAPALALFVVFIVVPFAQTVRLSFYSWDGILEKAWVGAANYRRLARDPVLRQALWNNCLYWWITLISEVSVGLLLAALIVRCRRGRAFFRLALSAPLLIALVASAVLWRQLLARIPFFPGPMLERLGVVDGPTAWLDPAILVVSVSLVSGWAYCGFYMLLFSAALERIPNELREAARLDGATEWQLFRRIELPLLRPTALVAFLLCTTGAFRAFDLFWVMAGPMLEPPSEVAATFVVKEAVTRLERGYSSAVAVAVVILVVTMGWALSRLVSRVKEIEY